MSISSSPSFDDCPLIELLERPLEDMSNDEKRALLAEIRLLRQSPQTRKASGNKASKNRQDDLLEGLI